MLELNPKRQIQSINNILSLGHLNVNDTSRLVADLRELSERIGNKALFPMLNLYGDWSLHAQLDRGKIQEALKKIEKQFTIPQSQESTSDLIAKIFSIRELQNEIISFESQIPKITIFKEKKIWINFISVFLQNILDKPLLQKDPDSQIENMYLKACSIDPTNGQINMDTSMSGIKKYSWVLKTRNDIKIYALFCLDYS
jgi:hypothetical protein